MKKLQMVRARIISNRIFSIKAHAQAQLGLSDCLDLDKTVFDYRSYNVYLDTENIPKSELALLIMQSCAVLPNLIWHVTPPKIFTTEHHASLDDLVEATTKATDKKRRAVLVVHGFNTNPKGAVERIAYLVGAVNDPNIDIYGFDWACFGGWKANYLKQGSPAHCSALDFQALVLMLAEHYEELDIVTHSMGVEVALPALAAISKETPNRPPLVNRLILVEPDMARMDYRKLYAQPVRRMIKSDRIEVLMSHFDLALVASWLLRYECDPNGDWLDMVRLGCPYKPAYIEGTHYMDSSILDITGLPLGHNMSDFYVAARLKGDDHAGDPRFEKVIRPGLSSIIQLIDKEKSW